MASEIRFIMIEDHPAVSEGIAKLLELSPEGNFKCVGRFPDNDPKLLEHIRQEQATVALVDISLDDGEPKQVVKDPKTSGFEVIQTLRHTFGDAIKIVVYTQYGHFRQQAIDVYGADAFFTKDGSFANLRQQIRAVLGQAQSPPDPKDLGMLTQLELFFRDRDYILHGSIRSTPRCHLQTVPFKFLLYLAYEVLERQQGPQAERHWIEREPDSLSIAKWCITRPDMWQRIGQAYAVEKEQWNALDQKDLKNTGETIAGGLISGWVAKIHKPLGDYLSNGARFILIDRPQYARTDHYAIRAGLRIKLHDSPL